MDRKFLIRILELLDETYPESYSVERLTKYLNVIKDGIFSKSMRYLRLRNKIIATEVLHPKDMISITPEGIDFLSDIKLLEVKENNSNQQTEILQKQTLFTELLAVATLVLALGFILTFFKLELNWKGNDLMTVILVSVGICFIIFIITLIVKAIQYLFKLSTK